MANKGSNDSAYNENEESGSNQSYNYGIIRSNNACREVEELIKTESHAILSYSNVTDVLSVNSNGLECPPNENCDTECLSYVTLKSAEKNTNSSDFCSQIAEVVTSHSAELDNTSISAKNSSDMKESAGAKTLCVMESKEIRSPKEEDLLCEKKNKLKSGKTCTETEEPVKAVRNAILSDAYVADLLSVNSDGCMPNKKCDSVDLIPDIFYPWLVDVPVSYSIKSDDTSISAKDSSDMKELTNARALNLLAGVEIDTQKEEVLMIANSKLEAKQASLSSLPLTEEAVNKLNESNAQCYREVDSGTDDDDSSSTFSLNSSSDCSDSFLDKMHKNVNTVPKNVLKIKTKGELDLDELPLIEDLHITLSENEMKKVGVVHAIVDKLVIVRSLKTLQPLNLESVLFLSSQKAIGKIFDVLGPVLEPFYAIRFNSLEHIVNTGIEVQADVFYAPDKGEITKYVFVDELRKQKGSDASWKDNNEPPEEYLDFSDDEQEKAAKQKRRAKNRPHTSSVECESLFKRPDNRSLPTAKKDNQSPDNHNSSLRLPRTPYKTVVAPAKYPFRSMNSNLSNSNASNSISMADVMSSDYRPSSFRPQDAFQGPSAVVSQPTISFVGHRSYQPQQQHVSAPEHRNLQTGVPHEIPFHRSESFGSQPQQNLSPRPPALFSYCSSPSPVLHTQTPFSYYSSPSPVLQPQVSLAYQTSPPPVLQPHRANLSAPIRFPPPPLIQQQQATWPKPVIAFNQPSHVFAQITPLGPVSPALQQPTTFHFAPPAVINRPLVPVSFPTASPDFSYYRDTYVSSPSPMHLPSSTNWYQGQPISTPPPRMRVMAPMSPLSVQIPNNLKSPPPTIPVAAINAYSIMSPIYPTQNRHFVHQPHLRRY